MKRKEPGFVWTCESIALRMDDIAAGKLTVIEAETLAIHITCCRSCEERVVALDTSPEPDWVKQITRVWTCTGVAERLDDISAGRLSRLEREMLRLHTVGCVRCEKVVKRAPMPTSVRDTLNRAIQRLERQKPHTK